MVGVFGVHTLHVGMHLFFWVFFKRSSFIQQSKDMHYSLIGVSKWVRIVCFVLVYYTLSRVPWDRIQVPCNPV